MPKYTEAPVTFWTWVIVFVVFSFFAWLIWSAPVFLLIVPVLIYLEFRNRKDQKKYFDGLLKTRLNDSICTFSKHFDCKVVDTWVIRVVYEQIQNYIETTRQHFPICPNDDVFVDLCIDDEDFELDLVSEIAERNGRTLDNAEDNQYYGKASIVKNLVYFFMSNRS